MLMSGEELGSLNTPLSSHQRSWLAVAPCRRERRSSKSCVCIAGWSRHYTTHRAADLNYIINRQGGSRLVLIRDSDSPPWGLSSNGYKESNPDEMLTGSSQMNGPFPYNWLDWLSAKLSSSRASSYLEDYHRPVWEMPRQSCQGTIYIRLVIFTFIGLLSTICLFARVECHHILQSFYHRRHSLE